MRRLPPLNPLRVFEAAARFESFNRAAEHLHVTASAVSHQVKALEQYLGVALFRRAVRQVTLTEAGRAYLPPIRDALEQIGVATEQLLQRSGRSVVTVSSAPAFASGWLVPRLAEFQLAHPDIEVRLEATVQLTDFDRSDVDVCIRYSARDSFPGLRAHALFREELVPVCSPAFARENGIERPADLRQVRLLHAYTRMGQWRSWLEAAGVDDIDPEAGQRFEDNSMSLEAAVAGLGVAIVNRPLVEKHLESGRVIAPFDLSYCSEYAFHVVYPPSREDDPKVVAFRDWALGLAESAGDVDACPPGTIVG